MNANAFLSTYAPDLGQRLDLAYEDKSAMPKRELALRAFELCPFEALKVVILGQDPYLKNASGLAFGVENGAKIAPSLRNIFKELEADCGILALDTSLASWARQGVLLLNTALSTNSTCSNSHKNIYKGFASGILKGLSCEYENLVFMLWGNNALAYEKDIKGSHLILRAAHPSPLARGKFFGCKHFSQANAYLKSHGKGEIAWG